MWSFYLFDKEFYELFYIFILYSIFGWIYESCLVSIQNKSLVNRGFLTGPMVPIYGCGALLVYLVLWDYRENSLLVFAMGAVLATLLEYGTSLIMELLFHTVWWDYSQYPLNIKGRVCLFVTLFWGFLSLLMVHILHPFMLTLIHLIPKGAGEIIGFVIIPLFLTDVIFSVVSTIKFDQILAKLHNLRQDMTEYISATKIYETGEELRLKFTNLRISGLFSEVRAFIDNLQNNKKWTKRISLPEIKKLKPEIEGKMKEFLKRYQNIRMKRSHLRLLKAFPRMKAGKRDAALRDLRDKLSMKGVITMGKDFKEEVTGTVKGYLSGFLRATLVGLLVLAQFALIIYLSIVLRGYTIYLYTGLQVLSILIVIGLVNDNRNASYKISWICIIAAFPITGHIMFMLWGNRRRMKIDKRVLEKLQRGMQYLEFDHLLMDQFTREHPTKSRMSMYLETNGFPLYDSNHLTYYPMGEDAFEAIFEDMKKAEKFILVDFYIIGEGVLWDRFNNILKEKQKEGVKILFLYDDFGGMLRTSRDFRKNLEKEGFEVRVFNPIHKYTDQLYMNYRSHQKIIVIDGNVGFTGGMNLADEYVNLVQRFGTWKDNAIRVEGAAVWGLTVTFLQMWEVSGSDEPMDYNPFRPTITLPVNDVYCQVVSDGPANNPKNPVENIYKQMIYYAKKVLYITTPYLIIEDDMREALTTAARSGIDVRIITPFIPDKKHVKLLTEYHYGRLLEAGVRIFEYTPGFIHAKTILNEECGIVGTINMDYRSFHLQYECGVWFCDQETVDTVSEDLLKTMEQSHEVTYEEWKSRPRVIRIYQKVLNVFSTLM